MWTEYHCSKLLELSDAEDTLKCSNVLECSIEHYRYLMI